MLYQKGNTIVCAGSGVCEIVDIRHERFAEKFENYYILSPIYEMCPTKVFIPVANENTRLRPLVTEDEINGFISAVGETDNLWVDDEKSREKVFSDIIKSGDYTKIIKMIKEIYEKQKEKKKNGGKLRQSDERLLKEAQSVIEREFAFVLNITPQDVKNYILKKLA